MLRVHAGVAALLALEVATGRAIQAPDTSARAVTSAATAYVERYTKAVEFLVADENYTQVQFGADDQELGRRIIRSELFLTFLPADREWLIIRDPFLVDEKTVAEYGDVRKLLTSKGDARGLLPELVARNARFNIGRIERNFNEPTLPLLLVDPKRAPDVRFERREISRDGDVTLVTLVYSERDRGGLIRGPLGPVRAEGELVVEAQTGVIRRTTLALKVRDLTASLETEYAHNERLDLWLPDRFVETYEHSGMVRERVTGEARYDNYRRFEVSVRIR
jgi:hypothetical protein